MPSCRTPPKRERAKREQAKQEQAKREQAKREEGCRRLASHQTPPHPRRDFTPYRPVDRSSDRSSAPTGADWAGPPAPPPPPPTGRASHRIASHRIASHRIASHRIGLSVCSGRRRRSGYAPRARLGLTRACCPCSQDSAARHATRQPPRTRLVANGRPSAVAYGRPGAVVMSRHVTSHPALPLPLPLPLPVPVPLQTEGGRTTTLGRNGSDYTATLVRAAQLSAAQLSSAQLSAAGAAQRAGIEYSEYHPRPCAQFGRALEAEEVVVMTDVPGGRRGNAASH
jgi:hypothetical protein